MPTNTSAPQKPCPTDGNLGLVKRGLAYPARYYAALKVNALHEYRAHYLPLYQYQAVYLTYNLALHHH
ncbi:hypothetical protein GCM10023172_25950 [Hymenobacter ginsengisoli]|uniref:Uncharacterized protein n=1 Tax=Hymenobacter ginsengisoli TaxID=1051626 RepID=A0ABP8QI46_9BACT